MYSISDLYRNICFSYIFNNDLMIRDRNFFMSSSEQRVYIYKFTHMSNTYEMKYLNPCREEAFTMQQKIYTFTNISVFFEVLFMIPGSGQYIYIYRFTHMSNTYEMKFLNPCSEEGIHIATEDLHIYKYFPIL